MGLRKIILPFLALLMLSAAALGDTSTHLNISVLETVHQNVTYAQNFFLTENQTSNLIEGALNITNPDTETVFDIELEFDFVRYIQTGFIWNSGRNGSQIRWYNTSLWTEYKEINSTWSEISNSSPAYNTSNVSATQDLDEDGNLDYISVNSTHLLLNISSQHSIIGVRLRNSSGDGVSIANASGSPVDVNVSGAGVFSLPNGPDSLRLFANVTILGTVDENDTLPEGILINITDTARNHSVIHIPELRGGESTKFVYNLTNGVISPPLDLETNYTHTYNRKVLAGHKFTINDSVTNQIGIGQPVTNINITIQALNVTWNTSEFNFTLHNLSSVGDWSNVSNHSGSNRTWSWIVGGGTLTYGENKSIVYEVRAPDSVPTSATYLAVRQSLQYQVNYASSNLTLVRADARGDINFTVSKQIVQPADNNQNRNVTWKSVPTIAAKENITYTLTQVSLWVTNTTDPNQNLNLEKNYTTQAEFNLSSSWSGGSSSPWYFNFTDGSNSDYPPPIVWIKPYWVISNAYNQILNASSTVNGTDLYMKYIYVINGYWLEVEKNVSDIGDDQYRVDTWVHNKGNGWTPVNMTVTVYDFVPSTFTAFSFNVTPNNQTNVTGEFTGTAYKWDVGLKAPLYASLAPDDGAPAGNDTWRVQYYVNGSGDYVVSDLYIVGLDPRLVDGARASPLISVIAVVSSYTKEFILAGIVIFLVALNAVNLLMTSRISKKLDQKGFQGKEENIRKELDQLKKR